jgi:hypothetical protein
VPREIAIKLWDGRGRHPLELSKDEIQELPVGAILEGQQELHRDHDRGLIQRFARELKHIRSSYRPLAVQQAIRSVQKAFEEATGFTSVTAALAVLQREFEASEIAVRIAGITDADKAAMSPAKLTKLRLNEIAAQSFNGYGHYTSSALNSKTSPPAVTLARAIRNQLSWLKRCTGYHSHLLWKAAISVMTIVEDTMVARGKFIQQRIADGKRITPRPEHPGVNPFAEEDCARLHQQLQTQIAQERAQARARYIAKKNLDSTAETALERPAQSIQPAIEVKAYVPANSYPHELQRRCEEVRTMQKKQKNEADARYAELYQALISWQPVVSKFEYRNPDEVPF